MENHYSKPLFRLEKARLGYPDNIVLDGIDWQVHYGERWAIVGPNGAGKTTLVKTLLGLLPIQGGRLTYYEASGVSRRSAPSVGYLPQINQLDRAFPISSWEVIDSGLYGLGLSKGERKERIDELLNQIGLACYASTPIGKLSGGQLQRILLARALAACPDLVVLDEPMSFLDRVYKEGFEELLFSMMPKESTILMVTHDLPNSLLNSWKLMPLGQW